MVPRYYSQHLLEQLEETQFHILDSSMEGGAHHRHHHKLAIQYQASAVHHDKAHRAYEETVDLGMLM
jgi:hypothetical protein